MKTSIEKRVVLEPSTHTHTLESENNVKVTKISSSVIKMTIKGDGIVTHGEHGTIRTEAETVIKYTQKEYNPVTKAMQNAFD